MVALVLILAENVPISVLHWPFLKESDRYVEGVMAKYGKWLETNSSPSDTVACYDVGAIADYRILRPGPIYPVYLVELKR